MGDGDNLSHRAKLEILWRQYLRNESKPFGVTDRLKDNIVPILLMLAILFNSAPEVVQALLRNLVK